ncbi:MAG: type II toxin-antitoxin system VapC family toxin [Actinobacteria bacterium]|nr:type II toxin-antitoxin system VapC family toxin [Actinomycetota bacterium]
MLIVDASAVIAALVDSGPDGVWAESLLATEPLAAPHLMPVEAANILRRAAQSRDLGEDLASLAHAAFLQLPVELFPYEPFAERVWELRSSVTPYDAWYVALAESLQARLMTLDLRLARATRPGCEFEVPPARGSVKS